MTVEKNILPILKALTTFEAAARCQSFTAAAEMLGMAQPSVSRFISILENYVGVSLFKRISTGVQLTIHGEELFQKTSSSFDNIRSALDEISSKVPVDEVSICCTYGFAHMWVIPRLELLKTQPSNHKIRVVTGEPAEKFSVELNNIVVRFGRGNWADGNAHLLFKEEVFPVCTPEFAKKYNLAGRIIDPAELAQVPLLVRDHGEHGWLGWKGWFSHFGIDIDKSLEEAHNINNYAFTLQAAMEGKGIALAWRNLIGSYLSNGWLQELPRLRVKSLNGYYLVTKNQDQYSDIIAGLSKPVDNM